VGAGPAGTVLGLLLARGGVPVTLLESHPDFDRDYRSRSKQEFASDGYKRDPVPALR
jgi:2-polyprenyl-6-methoxyphenol hydroxylase-like FAD-dependent oxidoreductase